MMVMDKDALGKIATSVMLFGFAGHTLGLIYRWIESYTLGIGHAPLSNLYESLIFFSWTIILLYAVVEWRIKNRSIGAFVTPLAFLALAYASFSDKI
jgi:ABC-type transport system involved in cytochrome c biogenesis permease subunit